MSDKFDDWLMWKRDAGVELSDGLIDLLADCWNAAIVEVGDKVESIIKDLITDRGI